ncbi:PDR/VanB family oxidoreductase [Amycolatopsis pithecellobii]
MLRVEARRHAASGVLELELASPDGTLLPAWEPGAHIDVRVGDGEYRQYSLCGPPGSRQAWRIAVLREPDGRGGSQWLHDAVNTGDTLEIRGPRNHFRLETAPRYLFIAGGIGITPILPMLAAAESAGAGWNLVYGGRSRETMAFRDELARYGDRVQIRPQDESGLLELEPLLRGISPETRVYCCGPEALLDAVERLAEEFEVGSLHTERFRPQPLEDARPAGAFEVELASTGTVLEVPAERSVLSVVEAAGVDVLSSCAEGTCGTCETRVLAGEIDHRDSILDEGQRAGGDRMMICVSRCLGARLVLDL